MEKKLAELKSGYLSFRKKYAVGETPVMAQLAEHGQQPEVMVIACSDSRVDPALLLQCDPGDLFVVRNVANIVPAYKADNKQFSTKAALEYGICYLNVKHLIILGHSECGGINALLHPEQLTQNDFISSWVDCLDFAPQTDNVNEAAKQGVQVSHQHCMAYPWIADRVAAGKLTIHQWFFDVKTGDILELASVQKTK